MSKLQWRTARARCNSAGEWHLLMPGTGMCQLLYRYRHPELDPFPGNAMGHRLIELGWMPDRRAAIVPPGTSAAETLLATMYAGWKPSETEKWVWTIPVYREVGQ